MTSIEKETISEGGPKLFLFPKSKKFSFQNDTVMSEQPSDVSVSYCVLYCELLFCFHKKKNKTSVTT